MREGLQLPKRLADKKHIETMLEADMPAMTTIVEHRRGTPPPDPAHTPNPERTLTRCVQVELWTEADGTECLVVAGNEHAPTLELKGLLHDGLYAMAHAGEPSFTPHRP